MIIINYYYPAQTNLKILLKKDPNFPKIFEQNSFRSPKNVCKI